MQIQTSRTLPSYAWTTYLSCLMLALFLAGCQGLFDDLDVDSDAPNNEEAPNQTNGGSPNQTNNSQNGDACSDTEVNDFHCGSCDNACAYDQFCRAGQCNPMRMAFDTIGDNSFDDGSGWVGTHSALAFDDDEAMHIIYMRDGHLHHAHREASGDWSFETLVELDDDPGTPSGVFRWPSTAFDHQGRLHLTFLERGNLSHAIYEDEDWNFHHQLSTEMVGQHMTDHSMVIDTEGHLHAVVGTNASTMHHLSSDGGNWSHAFIDEANLGADSPRHPHTAAGLNADLHTVFTSSDDDFLHHAQFIDQQWTDASIGDARGAQSFMRIAVDDTGALHVAFVGQPSTGNGALYYAHRPSGESADWSTEQVTTGHALNLTMTMALDNHRRPHIAFVESDGQSNRDLHYARKTGDDWLLRDIDTDVDIPQGSHITLQIDRFGHPHLLYPDPGPDLVYATIE